MLRLRKVSADKFREELKGRVSGGSSSSSSSSSDDGAVSPCGGDGVSIVRELHVYGTAIPVAARDPGKFQHQGFGTLLMEEAARIAAEEHGSFKIAVISGVGTRHYYRKLGYQLEGPYMTMLL